MYKVEDDGWRILVTFPDGIEREAYVHPNVLDRKASFDAVGWVKIWIENWHLNNDSQGEKNAAPES
jgi:hypothetical protein